MNLPNTIEIPWYASKAISILENAGYEAFIVGGCIRDAIMGRKPHDWDICTSARPEEMKKVFKDLHTIETGIQHGTITVIFKSEDENVPVEITTYRIDGEYSDGRHPDSVQFTDAIEEDLSRRDFTMNAMAYNPKIGFVDPFNGFHDIMNKEIRCVGEPDDRFKEDALRILRAFRFSLQYQFDIEEKTAKSLSDNIFRIDGLSKERITSEMIKMISYQSFWKIMKLCKKLFFVAYPELQDTFKFYQNNAHHIYDIYDHTMIALKYVRSYDPIVKFAILFHDIGKVETVVKDQETGEYHFPGHSKKSEEIARDILTRNRFDGKSIDLICQLILYHDMEIKPSKSKVKRTIRKFNKSDLDTAMEQFERYLLIREADIMAQNLNYALEKLEHLNFVRFIFEEIKNEEPTLTLKDLEINGTDLIAMDIKPGPMIGKILNSLLEGVIDGKISNTKEELKNHVINLIKTPQKF